MANSRVALAASVCALGLFVGCADEDGILSDDEKSMLESMTEVPKTQDDPTNEWSGDASAESFGQTLYWDQALSQDRGLSCSSCHVPSLGWSIADARSLGSGDTDGSNKSLSRWHSPGVQNLALGDYIFWDGRADSLWMQARGALTSDGVHRLAEPRLAKMVIERYPSEYEGLFGAPSVVDLGAVNDMSELADFTEEEQAEFMEISVNIGKAIAAYERTLVTGEPSISVGGESL